MDWAYLFKIGIALFAIVNPIGSVPIFISATDGWEQKQKMRERFKSMTPEERKAARERLMRFRQNKAK